MAAPDRTYAVADPSTRTRAAAVSLASVDPAEPIAQRAMACYFAELARRFPEGFDPGPLTQFSSMTPPGGTFVLAVNEGEPVACGGLQRIGEGIGEIKRMWVHEAWRGAGLGSRVLHRLEEDAAALGHWIIRLDTTRTLTEALALYARAGYRPIDRYNDNPFAHAFFEKVLNVAK